MTTRVLVAGGTGFIGATDMDLGGFDAVVNAAALLPGRSARIAEYLDVNTTGALALAEVARRDGVPAFVQISTGNTYRQDDRAPAHEDVASDPVGPHADYLVSKVAAEFLLVDCARAMSLTTLRLGTVSGSGMARGEVVAVFNAAALRGAPLRVVDGGIATADFVHVDDVAEVIVRACTGPELGPLNLSSGRAISIRELARSVLEVTGSPSELIAPGAHAHPPVSRVQGRRALDVTKARTLASFAPMTLREGLELTIAHWEPDA